MGGLAGRSADGRLNELKRKAASLPDSPGVYVFKDEEGRILYVGKAASLKNRVKSYFAPPATLPAKIRAMMARARDLEFIVTDTELEAFVLESNLIKTEKPRYNVLLRDDKHYPYLRVSVNEEWPRVGISRSVKDDGARYFGPYYPSGAVTEVLRLARRLFPMRTCSDNALRNARRPCLNYHIGRCPAPCRGLISREEYGRSVDNLCMFLEGRHKDVLVSLTQEMKAAAQALDFEKAAKIRDQIRAIERMGEEQKAISTIWRDMDVVGLARDEGKACVMALFVRKGRLIGRRHYLTEDTPYGSDGDAEVVAAFLKHHYRETEYVPPEILIPLDLERDDARLLPEWLSRKKGGKVDIRHPQKGEKRRLVEMATRNAKAILEAIRMEEEAAGGGAADAARRTKAAEELAEVLRLAEPPRRLECFDISDIQGKDAVGSMVVFEDGVPLKSGYRRFKVKSREEPNDFLMMKEVVGRRLKRIESEGGPWSRPDLLIVDGGKPQLLAAMKAMEETGVTGIPVVGLAKERELVHVPWRDDPIALPRNSPALLLLQHIRDEAHRFAIAYHRNIRSKRSRWSPLDEVEGIGPKRKKMLIGKFGSLQGIKEASVEEIASIPGIGKGLAAKIKAQVRE
ncbi:MAG TPA: excinuclease ABC subunit UvrC [Clostridia bacterium]|nr:excinuclease ABC subunit UvrC [Clostridia bacterium]